MTEVLASSKALDPDEILVVTTSVDYFCYLTAYVFSVHRDKDTAHSNASGNC
jgi:hypothetical protein